MLVYSNAPAWRLQDAKAQFSAVVEGALRGVPQHITRRGKQAVVLLSEQDFAALQNQPGEQANSFVQYLLAMPTEPAARPSKTNGDVGAGRAKLALRDLDL